MRLGIAVWVQHRCIFPQNKVVSILTSIKIMKPTFPAVAAVPPPHSVNPSEREFAAFKEAVYTRLQD